MDFEQWLADTNYNIASGKINSRVRYDNIFHPRLLQMNMAGYVLVLPDMIGGNGYDGNFPSKEIFLRWLQANIFMPSLQFSYVPWDYDAEVCNVFFSFSFFVLTQSTPFYNNDDENFLWHSIKD